MNTSFDFMDRTQLLGIHISNDIANRIINYQYIIILYTSFMPKLTVFCMILEMFFVKSMQS